MKLRWAKFLTGLLLLPLCASLSMTCWRAILILAQSPTRLPMLHAFAAVSGIAIWAIGHALSVWAARRDPQFVDVARRHVKYPTWVRP